MGSKYKIGYTAGAFDMFHVGHLNLLKNSKANCKHLIVGISTNELVMNTKNKKPVIPFEERIEIVRAIRFVDQVVIQETLNKMDAWERLHFDVMFSGDDWKDTPRWKALDKQFAQMGVPIIYFPYTKVTSSTLLRKKIESFDKVHE